MVIMTCYTDNSHFLSYEIELMFLVIFIVKVFEYAKLIFRTVLAVPVQVKLISK